MNNIETATIIDEKTQDTPLTGQEEEYAKEYSDEKFFKKTSSCAKLLGRDLLTKAFTLYFLIKSDNVPMALKVLAIAGLGYLISPVDLVPDIIPIFGYGDDATVIASIFVMLAEYNDPEIAKEAAKAVNDLLG